MQALKNYFNNTVVQHILFWCCVFLYFMFSSNIINYPGGYLQLFHSVLKIIIPQIVTAYVCLYVLIPKLLNTKKNLAFALWLMALLIVSFSIYTVISKYFYEPKYFEYYSDLAKEYAQHSFFRRLLNFDVFLSKSIKFLTPTALLVLARFYNNQQQFLQLQEQKKTAELLALKNQLNPHFLFNTLNNLYALALEKSEKTPEVIERLSDILDYILYRCKDKYVPLKKEVVLIENYLALEKVRYGKRVDIQFNKTIKPDSKIAPLILLTFIENAFKHGVKHELKQARIRIDLNTEDKVIAFKIENTKPNANTESSKEPLGLKNVKQQLYLLYPETHNLEITETEHLYSVSLTLKSQ